MFIAFVVVTVLTIAANTWAVAVDFAKAKAVMDNAASVGIPASWVPALGAIKGLGVIGLVVGLAGVRWIGIAAAAGLTLFFIGAIIFHVRARVFRTMPFPGMFLALAAVSLALAVLE